MSDDGLRAPPNSREAEESLIGGLLIGGEKAWLEVADKVASSDFYQPRLRHLWDEIAGLIAVGEPADMVTVAEALGTRLEQVGIDYIADLTESTPSSRNVVAWARIVRQRSTMRALIRAAGEIADGAFGDHRDGDEVVAEATAKLDGLAEDRTENLLQAREFADRALARVGVDAGIPTGLPGLDEATRGGFQRKNLVVLAARPGTGKTTLAAQIADRASRRGGVLFVSLEMGGEEIATRLLAAGAGIPPSRWAHMDERERERLADARRRIRETYLIDDSGGLSVADMAVRARRVARETGGLALVVVDFLQTVRAGAQGESRAVEVGNIARDLKALAMDLDCPVLACAQLNRGVESRADKRPNLSDLRASGEIEEAADIVLFMHQDDEDKESGVMRLSISKHRTGRLGGFRLSFERDLTRFRELAP